MFVEGANYDLTHHIFLGRHCPGYLENGRELRFFVHFLITEKDSVLW